MHDPTCTYWNLSERPFEERCDTRFFFESEEHREALDRMLYVVNDRNMSMGLLTGEVGSGKTMTRSVLMSSLPGQHYEVIGFENSNIPFDDILYDILLRTRARGDQSASAMPARGDRYLLMSELHACVETLAYRDKRHLVLAFDEAQQMNIEDLDQIKNLTNISDNAQSLLTIFFFGQPELREKVRSQKQIDQRIFLRFHLNNLDYLNSVNYIQHRLRVAGLAGGGVFTTEAFEAIFRRTGGVPREINRLCKLALAHGFAHDLKELGSAEIETIADDFGKHY